MQVGRAGWVSSCDEVVYAGRRRDTHELLVPPFTAAVGAEGHAEGQSDRGRLGRVTTRAGW